MVDSNNARIENGIINDLVDELAQVRIQSERSVREIEQLIREKRRREARLEQRILCARATVRKTNQPNQGRNPFIIRDTVQITNSLRNECGATGIVISSGICMVTLRNNESSRVYTRAHWNLEYALIRDDKNDQQSSLTLYSCALRT